MRQTGTLTEGELLQADASTEIMQSGELCLVRRSVDGVDSFFVIHAKSQPLTPTFIHDVIEEGAENINENDQRDFVCTGAIPMKDKDMISFGGYLWKVSTAAEMMNNGVTCTTHCLCIKNGTATF